MVRSVRQILVIRFRNVPVLRTETIKISYYISRFLVGFFAPWQIPDIWVYRAHGEREREKKKELGCWFSFRVFTNIVVGSIMVVTHAGNEHPPPWKPWKTVKLLKLKLKLTV